MEPKGIYQKVTTEVISVSCKKKFVCKRKSKEGASFEVKAKCIEIINSFGLQFLTCA